MHSLIDASKSCPDLGDNLVREETEARVGDVELAETSVWREICRELQLTMAKLS